jgi:hypothetical protein
MSIKHVYLSIFPAMGQSSDSANCRHVSFNIACVSGRSVNDTDVDVELSASTFFIVIGTSKVFREFATGLDYKLVN